MGKYVKISMYHIRKIFFIYYGMLTKDNQIGNYQTVVLMLPFVITSI